MRENAGKGEGVKKSRKCAGVINGSPLARCFGRYKTVSHCPIGTVTLTAHGQPLNKRKKLSGQFEIGGFAASVLIATLCPLSVPRKADPGKSKYGM